MECTSTAKRQPLPLWLFAALEWPYGIGAGTITLVAVYLLRKHGVPIAEATGVSAFAQLPATFYFLYSPAIDFLVRRRTWLMVMCSAVGLFSFLAITQSGSHHIRLIMALLFTMSIANMLVSAATGGIMATMLTREEKASVGSWVQLGNLGANALGFGALAWMSERVSLPVLGLCAAAMVLPGFAALLIAEPKLVVAKQSYGEVLRSMGHELRHTFLSWRSLPGMLLLLSPVGTGALITTFVGVSKDYGVTAGQIALVNGLGGGIATATGAMATLLMPKRWNRLIPYAVGGLFYGAASIGLGLAPVRPATFVVGMLAMNLMQGLVWGAYTGVILQTMAGPGRFQSSRYTVLNSLGNMPVVYMTWLCGKVAGRFDSHMASYFETAMNFAAAGIFFGWWFFLRKPWHAPEMEETPQILLAEKPA
jgi:PAT family beta-lactamase induction signal transducer AmpG